jgi:hypothetical protein
MDDMDSDSLVFIPLGSNGHESYLGIEAAAVRSGVFELTAEPRSDLKTAYHKGDHVRCEIRPVETPNGAELMQIVTAKVDPA